MKALVSGNINGGITAYKGADFKAVNLMLIEDDGSLIDLTGDTVEVEIYVQGGRGGTAVATITASLATAASGLCSLALTDTETDALAPGSYDYFVKRTENSSGDVHMSGPGKLTVK